MSTRVLKPVWLFQTQAAVTVYETKKDLDEDLDMIQSITGVRPDVEVREVPMVVASVQHAPPVQVRKKVDYPETFEQYWQTYEPKRRKQKVFEAWKLEQMG